MEAAKYTEEGEDERKKREKREIVKLLEAAQSGELGSTQAVSLTTFSQFFFLTPSLRQITNDVKHYLLYSIFIMEMYIIHKKVCYVFSKPRYNSP